MNIDSLIHARWIIPVVPEGQILEHHSLAIDKDKIIDLLPTSEAKPKYQASNEFTLTSHALLPGLINAHTHGAMNLFRGLADDLPLMDWLTNHIWPAEQKWISPEFVRDGTQLAVAEMIRGGITCFNDMYFFPDATADVATEYGVRAGIGLILIDFPTAWAHDADEYIYKGEQVHDKYRHNPLVHTVFAPHAPYTVSDAPLARISTLAEELNIPIHMHVHETRDEVEGSVKQHGKRPLQRLHELGLVNERLLAVHMTQLQKDEIELIARYGVHVLHCPESNLKLASGFCPVHELQEAGVNVALGTDGAASNNDLDMFAEMRTAALLAKGVANTPTALPARKALSMATINAARALNIDTITGSLEINKSADVIAVNLNQIETLPLFDPVSQIVYACSRQQVTDVWVAGTQLLDNSEFTRIDREQLLNNVTNWQSRISAS